VQQCSVTLVYFFNNTCVDSCFDGTYLMTDKVTCGSCSSICATCSIIASNCTKCIGAFLYNFNCVSTCPANYYADVNLVCQVCNANIPQCNVSPLTYTLSSFNTNGALYGILVFSRPADMDLSQIKKIVNLTIAGIPSNSYGWTCSKINSTSYKLNIESNVSLN